jgi:arylsulfatase
VVIIADDLGFSDLQPRPAPYQGFFNDRCATLAEILRSAGYRTYMSGKWHLGGFRPHWPVDCGFDRYFGLLGGAANYFDPAHDRYPGLHRRMALDNRFYEPPKHGFYMTDAIADHAVEYIGEAGKSDEPFFLYTAFTAPHFPNMAPAADTARNRGRYRGGWDALREERYRKMRSMGIVDAKTPMSPRNPNVLPWAKTDDQDIEDLKMAIYAAQIEVMDRGIGRMLAKLRAIGREENTLIFFTSDHGACAARTIGERDPKFNLPPYLGGPESYAPYGYSWANASNTPWRKYKDSLWEGGIRVPMIAACPGAVATEGGICPDLTHHTDFMPTILELAGGEYPEQFRGRKLQALEGASFARSLQGRTPPSRGPMYWELEGMRAVRDKGWKLVANDGGPWSLYHLAEDPSELRDLSRDVPDRVRQLETLWSKWAERCGVLPWREISAHMENLGPRTHPSLINNGLGPGWQA